MHLFRNKTTSTTTVVASTPRPDFSGHSRETEVDFYEEPPTFQRVREGIIVGHKPHRRLKNSFSSSSNISASTIDDTNKFDKEVRKQSCDRRTFFRNSGMFARSMFTLNLKPKMYAHNSFLSKIEESQTSTRRLSTKSITTTMTRVMKNDRKNSLTNAMDDDDLLYQVSDIHDMITNSEDRFANYDDYGYYDAKDEEPESKENKQNRSKDDAMKKFEQDCLKVQSKLSAIYRNGKIEMKSSMSRFSTPKMYKISRDQALNEVSDLIIDL